MLGGFQPGLQKLKGGGWFFIRTLCNYEGVNDFVLINKKNGSFPWRDRLLA